MHLILRHGTETNRSYANFDAKVRELISGSGLKVDFRPGKKNPQPVLSTKDGHRVATGYGNVMDAIGVEVAKRKREFAGV